MLLAVECAVLMAALLADVSAFESAGAALIVKAVESSCLAAAVVSNAVMPTASGVVCTDCAGGVWLGNAGAGLASSIPVWMVSTGAWPGGSMALTCWLNQAMRARR